MAGAATRSRARPRRPFAPVAVSPPPPQAEAEKENRLAHEDAPPSLKRPRGPGRIGVGACAGKDAGGNGKAANKCGSGSSPVCFSSAKRTPLVAVKRSPRTAAPRRRLDSCANKCSTPAVAAAAARAPVSGAAEERHDVVRDAEVSYPCSVAEADQERRGSDATRAVAVEEVLEGPLPDPGEGRVKYLVSTFERLLLLGGGGPAAQNRGGAAMRRKNQAAAAATATVSLPATPRGGAEEIHVSYPSIASSSEVSFPCPAIPGVACILDASDRTRISLALDQRRQRAYNSTGSSSARACSCSKKVTRVTAQQPFRLMTEGKSQGRKFCREVEEDAAGGGKDAQSTRARFTLHH